jgi:hypothetical protein
MGSGHRLSVRRTLELRTGRARALACTALPDGAVIAAAGGEWGLDDDHVVELVDLIGGEKWYEIALADSAMDLAFTGDHRLIVRTYLDVAVYDLP